MTTVGTSRISAAICRVRRSDVSAFPLRHNRPRTLLALNVYRERAVRACGECWFPTGRRGAAAERPGGLPYAVPGLSPAPGRRSSSAPPRRAGRRIIAPRLDRVEPVRRDWPAGRERRRVPYHPCRASLGSPTPVRNRAEGHSYWSETYETAARTVNRIHVLFRAFIDFWHFACPAHDR
jgi:hypothetical protein